MHRQASNVVGVSLERGNLFVRVVVEHAQLEIIGASDEPVLAGDKANTSYRDFCDFKGFHQCSCLVVVNVDRPVIKTCEQPWLRWMEVDTLDAI